VNFFGANASTDAFVPRRATANMVNLIVKCVKMGPLFTFELCYGSLRALAAVVNRQTQIMYFVICLHGKEEGEGCGGGVGGE
jgi:hypothetical protein